MVRYLIILVSLLASGCAAFPDVHHRPTVQNPFPQLHRVAVMPFNNLSDEATLNGEHVANQYFAELQKVPGFEVIPVGVVLQRMKAVNFPAAGATTEDYRRLGQSLGADAVVAGAVTDYRIYSPPRLALVVNWYATNPGFHPVPPGYGLPWGTSSEGDIPNALLYEAEFALAREQLATQTPYPASPAGQGEELPAPIRRSTALLEASSAEGDGRMMGDQRPVGESQATTETGGPALNRAAASPRVETAPLPPGWPDPKGFIPPAPSVRRPPYLPQPAPVMTLTRFYDGDDSDFTEKLAKYYYFRDDGRFGGWQSYLTDSDAFIGFCCHLHINEMLVSRGGAGKSRVVWRWPIGRYER